MHLAIFHRHRPVREGTTGIPAWPPVALAFVVVMTAWRPAFAQPESAAPPPLTNPSSVPDRLIVVGGTLFFSADDGQHGRELWMTEGTGSCSMAADLAPGIASSNPDKLTDAGGWLYFRAETPALGCELWAWDPRLHRMHAIGDFFEGPQSSTPEIFGFGNGVVYFSAESDNYGRELWVSVPGEFNATLIADITPGPKGGTGVRGAIGSDGSLVFYAAGGLWRSDGTRDGTQPIITSEAPIDMRNSGVLCPLGSRMFFTWRTRRRGIEPWITDGTPEGTHVLKNISGLEGRGTSFIEQEIAHNGAVFFGALDQPHGLELWKTDGTPDGTMLVKDICPGRDNSGPHYFASADQWVYFRADDGIHGTELWRSDGTEEETKLVLDLTPGAQGSDTWSPVDYSGRMYLCANSPRYGEEVFSTDGTPGSLRLLRDIVPGRASSGPHQLTPFNDLLYFSCDDGVHGEELWLTDGTEQGTRLAADIHRPYYNPASAPDELTALGDCLLFIVSDLGHGRELWRSDGTPEGTHIVLDIAPGTDDASPNELTRLETCVLFSAHHPGSGRELWTSDGTPEGTRLLRDLNPGPASSAPHALDTANGLLYFSADDGAHGREVWRSDGSPEGTCRLSDAAPGAAGTTLANLFEFSGEVWFYTRNSGGPPWLRRTDGTPEGTRPVWRVDTPLRSWRPTVPLTPPETLDARQAFLLQALHPFAPTPGPLPVTIDNATYFVVHTEAHGAELWRTDGSPQGSRLVLDIYPGPASSSPACLLPMGTLLYFIAEHPNEGRVLWRSDGTPHGTIPVRPRTRAVEYTIPPNEMTAIGDLLVYAAPPSINRQDTWNDVELHFLLCRKGREVKTQQSEVDIWPGREGSWPRQLTRVAEHVFFTADDGIHGRELWITDGTYPGTRLVKDILTPGDLSPRVR